MSGNSGAWGLAMWKDGNAFPGQANGISLAGGKAVVPYLPTEPLGWLTEPPEGMGVPAVRSGDVAFAQRDGVVQFGDYYEPRILTFRVSIDNEGCPGCGPGPSTQGALRVDEGSLGRAFTSDKASLDITGDLDIRVHIALDDWTPADEGAPISKWLTAGGDERSFTTRVEPSGLLSLYWSPDGAEVLSGISTAAPTVADGEDLWLRYVLDVDSGEDTRTVTFYTSTDGYAWQMLGDPRVQAGVTSVHAGTADLIVGSYNNGGSERLVGRVFYAEVRDGIDGEIVASPDFADQGARTRHFYDEDSNLWVVEAPASIIAVPGPTPLSARQRVARLTQEWSRNCSGATLVVFSDCHDPDATEEEKVYLGPYLVHGRPRVADVTWRRSDIGGADVLLRFDATDARLLLADASNDGSEWNAQHSDFASAGSAGGGNMAPDYTLETLTMTTNGAEVSDNHYAQGGPNGGPYFERVVFLPNTTSPMTMSLAESGANGIPVDEGTAYTISFWARKTPGGPAARIDLSWYDAAGVLILGVNGVGHSVGGEWQRFSQSFVAPGSAAFLSPRIVWTGTAVEDQVLDFAQAWINEGFEATGPVEVEVAGSLCVFPTITLSGPLTAPIRVFYGPWEFQYNEDLLTSSAVIDTRWGRAIEGSLDATQNLTGNYSSPLEPGLNDFSFSTDSPSNGSATIEWSNAVVSG